MIIRTYALYERDRRILVVLTTIALALIGVAIVSVIQLRPARRFSLSPLSLLSACALRGYKSC